MKEIGEFLFKSNIVKVYHDLNSKKDYIGIVWSERNPDTSFKGVIYAPYMPINITENIEGEINIDLSRYSKKNIDSSKFQEINVDYNEDYNINNNVTDFSYIQKRSKEDMEILPKAIVLGDLEYEKNFNFINERLNLGYKKRNNL